MLSLLTIKEIEQCSSICVGVGLPATEKANYLSISGES